MSPRVAVAVALAVTALVGPACGPTPAADKGRTLFSDPRLSPDPSNAFACATCHAVDDTPDPARRRPGYTLHDALARPSWWGGSYLAILDAVNECYGRLMRAAPLAADDPRGLALLVYLESLAPDGSAPALPLTVVKNIAAVPAGDAARGRPLYAAACAPCHGDVHGGSGRLASSIPVLPDDTIRSHGTSPQTGARPITVEKIRHGGWFGVGGVMPLFSAEALSDAEVGDLLAYLGL